MAIKRIGILVGGGPAPGTNGVISAVAIEAIRVGIVPIGFTDGFDWLAQRYTDEQHELTIDEVSRIHVDGGVLLGTSRRDITESAESFDADANQHSELLRERRLVTRANMREHESIHGLNRLYTKVNYI